MSTPATIGGRRPGRGRLGRRTALAAVVLVVVSAVVVACGDDARPTGAAYRVIAEPCQGRVANRATGVAIGPELVATVAHSLEGAGRVELRRGTDPVVAADLVYLDPGKDIALLRPTRPLADHLALTVPEQPGPVGVLLLDDEDRPGIQQGEILELVDATLDGEGRRAAARLTARVEPGDSGAGVLDDDGRVVAMIFATARNGEVGWAVSAVELEAAVETLAAGGPGARPPTC